MPSWEPLGAVSPGIVWDMLPTPTGRSLFKIDHIWQQSNWWRPRAIVTQWFGPEQYYPGVVIYAAEGTSSLIELPIPPDYIATGQAIRQIGVLLLNPPRRPIPPDISWSISIQAFNPE